MQRLLTQMEYVEIKSFPCFLIESIERFDVQKYFGDIRHVHDFKITKYIF